MSADGAGAGSQQSIGTGVFGGTLTATTLGLIMVPTFFVLVTMLFNPLHRRKGLGSKTKSADTTPADHK